MTAPYWRREVRSHRDIPRPCNCPWRYVFATGRWKLLKPRQDCRVHGGQPRPASEEGVPAAGRVGR